MFKLSLLFCSIMFFLISFELIIRVFYPYFSNYNMEMWRYSKDLKETTTNKKLPFVHKANQISTLYGVTIETDSNGFRINGIKRDFEDKILFLGDSFTLGWGVSSDSTFTNLVQEILLAKGNKIETINAGCGNYNTVMEVELLKKKGLIVNPKIIVLTYYINDIEPTPESISKIKYFFMTNFYIYGYIFNKYAMLKSKFDYKFKNNYYKTLYDNYYQVNFLAFQELVEICHRNNIKLLVTNIPDLRKLKEYPYNFATNHIMKIAENLNVEFLDFYPIIENKPPELLWVSNEDPHANAMVNNAFAKAIYNRLSEKNWVK